MIDISHEPIIRFIPVDTGNTFDLLVASIATTVHPRGYGEHALRLGRVTEMHGSSPWIRGTLYSSGDNEGISRFIPVDTGNTDYSFGLKRKIPVHPRGYGEHLTRIVSIEENNGSSPWIRGTQSATLRS